MNPKIHYTVGPFLEPDESSQHYRITYFDKVGLLLNIFLPPTLILVYSNTLTLLPWNYIVIRMHNFPSACYMPNQSYLPYT
jgi:hypothetical protein